MSAPHTEQMVDELDAEPDKEFSALTHVLTPLVTLVCCPLVCCSSWVEVKEKEEVVVLSFGKYDKTIKEAGCRWLNCFGTNTFKVVTAQQAMDLVPQKMVDGDSNPVIVSAVVIYRVQNAYRAVIEQSNYTEFLRTTASSTLKKVVSKYPYQQHNDSKMPSLQKGGGIIREELVNELQKSMNVAGIKVLDFKFNELSYAPEISSGMLKRQQALALVEARRAIVEGAVGTAHHAIAEMSRLGVHLTPEGQERLLTSLLTVMVSEGDGDG